MNAATTDPGRAQSRSGRAGGADRPHRWRRDRRTLSKRPGCSCESLTSEEGCADRRPASPACRRAVRGARVEAADWKPPARPARPAGARAAARAARRAARRRAAQDDDTSGKRHQVKLGRRGVELLALARGDQRRRSRMMLARPSPSTLASVNFQKSAQEGKFHRTHDLLPRPATMRSLYVEEQEQILPRTGRPVVPLGPLPAEHRYGGSARVMPECRGGHVQSGMNWLRVPSRSSWGRGLGHREAGRLSPYSYDVIFTPDVGSGRI